MKDLFRILKSTPQLWGTYAFVSGASIVVSIFNLLLPLITGWAIDEMQTGNVANIGRAAALAVAIFLLDFGVTIVSNVGGYVGDQMAEKLTRHLSNNYFSHLLKLPQNYFDTELSGKIINRLNRSIEQVTSFIHMMGNNFLQFIFSTIFSLVVVAVYSWQIALMLFALYPIYIWLTVKNSGRWLDFQKGKNEHRDLASGRFAEAITQMKVVKSFHQQKRELSFFSRNLDKAVAITKPQSRFWHIQDVKRRVILNAIFFGVYSFIFIQGVSGVFTTGEAVTLILYAMQIRIPIFTISYLVENTQKAVADSKDYFEVMNVPIDDHQLDNLPELKVSRGAISFDEVTFAYTKDKPVLHDLSFSVEPNTTLALVGESGEGKTTITNLLMRLYPLTQGRILIDEQDIAQHSLKSLRQNIGVVFQDPSLFSGTIKENIAYANRRATQKQVEQAAKAANAHTFICELKDGYNTQIGERGLRLSGGQKQRIAIARALLKDAPILILDEATSSLDSRSEKLVQEALDHLMKDRTTIIIAHRLSTIAKVDTIVTLKKGAIHEIGPPKQLAKTEGIYASLLALQEVDNKTNRSALRKFEIS